MLKLPWLTESAPPRTALAPRAAYELWADTYPPVAHNPLMRIEQHVVESIVTRIRATRALDVGTGSGRYLPVLGASAVGVDFSLAMLRRNHGGGRRICGDACRLPFRRAAFDLVNASLMIGDVEDLGLWAREMARVLSSDGHLIYSDFHPTWAANGWPRTFRSTDGRTLEVSLVPHTIGDHLVALEAAGFHVDAIREPRLKDDGDPAVRTFQRRWGNPPVVVVFHAIKDGCGSHQRASGG